MFKEKTWYESEKKVQEYMKENGYKIVLTNFSCVGVELDIVAIYPKAVQKIKAKQDLKIKIEQDKKHKSIYKNSFKTFAKTIQDLLVITEVKGRETDKYGLGSEQISDYKKNNIIRGARFLQTDKQYSKYPIRFDVASVDAGKITYIENAF